MQGNILGFQNSQVNIFFTISRPKY